MLGQVFYLEDPDSFVNKICEQVMKMLSWKEEDLSRLSKMLDITNITWKYFLKKVRIALLKIRGKK